MCVRLCGCAPTNTASALSGLEPSGRQAAVQRRPLKGKIDHPGKEVQYPGCDGRGASGGELQGAEWRGAMPIANPDDGTSRLLFGVTQPSLLVQAMPLLISLS